MDDSYAPASPVRMLAFLLATSLLGGLLIVALESLQGGAQAEPPAVAPVEEQDSR